MDLLLENPLALMLVIVTVLIHVLAFLLVHHQIRKGRARAQAQAEDRSGKAHGRSKESTE